MADKVYGEAVEFGWDEDKHPREKGKFASKAGSPAKKATAVPGAGAPDGPEDDDPNHGEGEDERREKPKQRKTPDAEHIIAHHSIGGGGRYDTIKATALLHGEHGWPTGKIAKRLGVNHDYVKAIIDIRKIKRGGPAKFSGGRTEELLRSSPLGRAIVGDG